MQDSGRHCMHIELDIEGSRLRYDAGDHVAIYPTNNLVRIICKKYIYRALLSKRLIFASLCVGSTCKKKLSHEMRMA
jgi:sulfite reductase alpha subunit-like flavoprotein